MRNVDIKHMIDRGKSSSLFHRIYPIYCVIWVNMGNADERESKTERVIHCKKNKTVKQSVNCATFYYKH